MSVQSRVGWFVGLMGVFWEIRVVSWAVRWFMGLLVGLWSCWMVSKNCVVFRVAG